MTLMVITSLQQKDLNSPRKVALLVGSASEQWEKPGIGARHSDSGMQGRIYFLLVTISMSLSKVQGDPLLKVKLSIAVSASLYPCTIFLVARRPWGLTKARGSTATLSSPQFLASHELGPLRSQLLRKLHS